MLMNNIVSKLTKRITIQYLADDHSWCDKCEIFANINAIADMKYAGIEIFNSMQLITNDPYLFIIRYIEGLNSQMRILYGDRLFNIKRIVNPYEKNHILKIIAQEELV